MSVVVWLFLKNLLSIFKKKPYMDLGIIVNLPEIIESASTKIKFIKKRYYLEHSPSTSWIDSTSAQDVLQADRESQTSIINSCVMRLIVHFYCQPLGLVAICLMIVQV